MCRLHDKTSTFNSYLIRNFFYVIQMVRTSSPFVYLMRDNIFNHDNNQNQCDSDNDNDYCILCSVKSH